MSSAPTLPSVSPTEALILELLDGVDRFGLELVAASQGRLKRGSVYVTLARMETKGFVESWQAPLAPGAIGLPRRVYRATSYGLEVLAAYRRLHEVLALRPKEAH